MSKCIDNCRIVKNERVGRLTQHCFWCKCFLQTKFVQSGTNLFVNVGTKSGNLKILSLFVSVHGTHPSSSSPSSAANLEKCDGDMLKQVSTIFCFITNYFFHSILIFFFFSYFLSLFSCFFFLFFSLCKSAAMMSA